jgi:hypothetical protein
MKDEILNKILMLIKEEYDSVEPDSNTAYGEYWQGYKDGLEYILEKIKNKAKVILD